MLLRLASMAGQLKVSGRNSGSPRWISELSDMADEVRDGTIIVKIRSQLHSWSDLDIQSIFSEFGIVEEVKLLPMGSRFHSQIRYQTIYDSEWACYYYQDSWFVPQNYCEIRVYRADEVICWNTKRIEANEEEKEEGSSHLVVQDEPISAKEPSVLVAHLLLEEMPRSIISQGVMFLDEIAKINDELVDRLDLKVPPLSSVEELHCSEFFHEFQVSNMRSVTALSLSKLEYIDWFKILNELPTQKISMMDYIGVLCFDPGGGSFRLIDIPIRKWLAEMTFVFGICLYSTAETVDDGEGSSQIRRYGPIVKTEISFQNAHHVFDEIPELEDCHFPKLFNEIKETKVFSVDFLNPDEYFDAPIENIDELVTLPTPRIFRFINEAEKKVKKSTLSSLADLRKSKLYLDSTLSGRLADKFFDLDVVDLEIKVTQMSKDRDKIGSRTFKNFCFDPRKGNSVAFAVKWIFMSAYGLSIGDVARLDVIYFNLGGAEFIFCAQIGQNVCYKLISFDPRGIKLKCHLHKLLGETMVFNLSYPYRDEVKNSILSRLADPQEPELHLNCTMSEKYNNIRCSTELLKIRKLFGASLDGIIMKQSVLLALKCDGVKDMRSSRRIRMQRLVFKSDLFTSIICSEIFCFDPGGVILLPTINSPKWCCSGMNLSIMMTCIKAHLLCKFSRVTFKATRASLLAKDGLSIFKVTVGWYDRVAAQLFVKVFYNDPRVRFDLLLVLEDQSSIFLESYVMWCIDFAPCLLNHSLISYPNSDLVVNEIVHLDLPSFIEFYSVDSPGLYLDSFRFYTHVGGVHLITFVAIQ